MKHVTFRTLLFALLIAIGLSSTSCKGKGDKNNTGSDTTTTMSAPQNQAPVNVTEDAVLSQGSIDATKDYPGVTATVNNGEITLTGNIERSRLQGLMQSLNSLRPKKINNNLTVK